MLVKRYIYFGGCHPRGYLVVSGFTALGRSAIADRNPSDGSDEEAEKRGLVHGESILYTFILLSNGMSRYAVQFLITR